MCTIDKKCCQNRRNTVILLFLNKTRLKQEVSLSPILFNLSLQKVIQSIKMVPTGIKIGKQQLNVLAYGDDNVLLEKMEQK